MRILVTGDREWIDEQLIIMWLMSLSPTTVIIQGGAEGADAIAKYYADDRGMDVLTFNADWIKYRKGAGPIRNQQMLDEGQPDEVHAFHNDIKNSKGTKDMIQRALKAGLPVYLHTSECTTKLERSTFE